MDGREEGGFLDIGENEEEETDMSFMSHFSAIVTGTCPADMKSQDLTVASRAWYLHKIRFDIRHPLIQGPCIMLGPLPSDSSPRLLS